MRDRCILLKGKQCFWTSDENEESYNSSDVIKMLQFVINNIYFRFGDKIFKQDIGIPMGTNCAPQVANLMLHNLEHEFVTKLRKEKRFDVCHKFRYVYRYIDDITVINGNGILDKWFSDIYPNSLSLEKVNNDKSKADVLDLGIEIEDKKFIFKTYDKRRDFKFNITNFPHITSNVPLRMCTNVFKDQIVRHFELNSLVHSFIYNIQLLIDTLKMRGYHNNILRFLVKKTFKEKIYTKQKYNTAYQKIMERLKF
jgi:hypothetical protein